MGVKRRRGRKRARGSRTPMPVALQPDDPGRKHGVSEGAFYAWKSKHSGMAVPDVKQLKALEDKLRTRLRDLANERRRFG